MGLMSRRARSVVLLALLLCLSIAALVQVNGENAVELDGFDDDDDDNTAGAGLANDDYDTDALGKLEEDAVDSLLMGGAPEKLSMTVEYCVG
jgi:hypothetical protein